MQIANAIYKSLTASPIVSAFVRLFDGCKAVAKAPFKAHEGPRRRAQ